MFASNTDQQSLSPGPNLLLQRSGRKVRHGGISQRSPGDGRGSMYTRNTIIDTRST
jgi:hypothetical protein